MWFGGKGRMVSKLLPLIPDHEHYIEVFGGGASLLFAKVPSRCETYNDLNGGLTCLFRVLRDPMRFPEFYRLATLTLHSRAECAAAVRAVEKERDPVRRAWAWFVVARQSFSGMIGQSWSFGRSGICNRATTWLAALAALPAIHHRLARVQIENCDWRRILDTYDAPACFAYLDPPYVHSTRSDTRYEHEMTDADHRDLVQRLLRYPGMAMLSAYDSDLYQPLAEAGWRKLKYRTACHAAGRTRHTGILGPGAALRMQPRTEIVWLNPRAVANQLPHSPLYKRRILARSKPP
jgi:DNA adenine methylase